MRVDDSEPMRKLVAFALQNDGHQVTTATNGAEALEHMNNEALSA